MSEYLRNLPKVTGRVDNKIVVYIHLFLTPPDWDISSLPQGRECHMCVCAKHMLTWAYLLPSLQSLSGHLDSLIQWGKFTKVTQVKSVWKDIAYLQGFCEPL